MAETARNVVGRLLMSSRATGAQAAKGYVARNFKGGGGGSRNKPNSTTVAENEAAAKKNAALDELKKQAKAASDQALADYRRELLDIQRSGGGREAINAAKSNLYGKLNNINANSTQISESINANKFEATDFQKAVAAGQRATPRAAGDEVAATRFKKAPFQTIIEEVPKGVGRVAERLARAAGLDKVQVTAGGQQVAQRSTISNQPNNGSIPTIARIQETGSESIGKFTENVAAVGQFAIPYVGTTLFLGSLAEKPILQPQEFKQQFVQNPYKTAVAYSLGLLAVKGGIGKALNYKEQKQLQEAFKTAKIDFVAEADQDLLRVLAKTRINGKDIITASEIRTILKSGDRELAAGTAGQFRKLSPDAIQILKQKVAVVADKLGESNKLVRELGGVKVSSKLVGEAFRARGRTQGVSQRIINAATKRPIGRIERIREGVTKSDVVGVISPTEAEDLFRVLAGSSRLRIYKQGGISYVFDPRIRGLLRIKPTIEDTFESKILLTKQLQKAKPLSALSAQVAKSSIEAAIKKEFPKAFPKVTAKASLKKPFVNSAKGLIAQSKLVTNKLEQQRISNLPTTVGGGGKGLKTYSDIKPNGRFVLLENETVNRRPSSSGRSRSRLKTYSEVEQLSIPKSTEVYRSGQRFRQLERTRQQERLREAQKSENRFKSAFAQPQSTAQGNRQGEGLRQEFQQKQGPRLRSRTSTPSGIKESPRIKVPPVKDDSFKKKKVGSKPLSKFKKYDAFVKRKGREVRVTATPTTKKAALGKALKTADTTLAASAYIKESSRPGFKRDVASERLARSLRYKFGASKKSSNILVEKSKFRLEKRGRTPETREIKSYKAFRGRKR